ncbi:MAG TPA: hypothetical protein VEU53_03545 [Stellaceae bacterium]|nr:hypothetical protein [Stellaceae bacterium]
MHSFLPKALLVLTLWSGTGLAVSAAQIAEAAQQPGLTCLAAEASAPAINGCQTYADVVTAALVAG